MDFFVFPHCKAAEKKLSQISDCGRLFAYPAVPLRQSCRMTILDSGAYGLSQGKRKMGKSYFLKLSEHYEKYSTEKTLCVAPDVVCDPQKTMRNFALWKKMGLFSRISPVVQPSGKHDLSIELHMYQIDHYVDLYGTKVIFLSNWLPAKMAIGLGIQRVVDHARKRGVEYIHVLGAGWSMDDVLLWDTVRGVNSCDSIAYYTAGSDVRFGSSDPAENARRILCALRKQ